MTAFNQFRLSPFCVEIHTSDRARSSRSFNLGIHPLGIAIFHCVLRATRKLLDHGGRNSNNQQAKHLRARVQAASGEGSRHPPRNGGWKGSDPHIKLHRPTQLPPPCSPCSPLCDPFVDPSLCSWC